MAGSPRSTSAAPRAPSALTGTQRPACAETAGSTPAVSTDLKITCKTNAPAPMKTRRPPILESRVPVTVRRGYEPPGWGAHRRRTTSSFKPIVVLLSRRESRKTPTHVLLRCTCTLYRHEDYLYV